MGNCNWFGAVPQDVLNRFQNGAYTPQFDEMGGLQEIMAMMDLCEGMLEAALGSEVFHQLIQPKLLCVVPRAYTGQTAFQIPAWALPIVPQSMSLWYGAPVMFQLEPRKRTEVGTSWGTNDVYRSGADWNDSAWAVGNFRLFELQVNQFAFDVNTGAGNILAPVAPMVQDQVVYVSFDVNFSDPTYGQKSTVSASNNKSLLSLATCLIDGVASMVGQNLYTQAQKEFSIITTMAKRWEDHLAEYKSGDRIVSELRLCRWWTPLDKKEDDSCISRRVFRS